MQLSMFICAAIVCAALVRCLLAYDPKFSSVLNGRHLRLAAAPSVKAAGFPAPAGFSYWDARH